MPVLIYNELKPAPEAEVIFRRWLANLNEEFTRHQNSDRRSEIVRDELHQIWPWPLARRPKERHADQRAGSEYTVGELRPAQRYA